MLTTLLEILGVTLLAVFAFFVWPPLPLLVVGAAILAGCWAAERGTGEVK